MRLSAVYRTMFGVLLLLAATAAKGQTVFPGAEWQVDKPEAQSMSSEGLEKVGAWLKANGSKTGMVVRHGRIVGEWYFDDAKPDSKYHCLFDHQVVCQHGRRIWRSPAASLRSTARWANSFRKPSPPRSARSRCGNC